MVNYSIKQVIDEIAYNENSQITHLLVLFACYKFAHHGMFFIRRLLGIKFNPKILQITLSDIYKKTMNYSMHWFESHLSGEISNKIADFQNSFNNIINYVFRCLVNILIVIISLIFIVQIHPQPAIILVVFVLVYSPVLYFLLKKQMTIQQKYVLARQENIGIINDSVSNIFTIKIIGSLINEYKLNFLPALLKWVQWDKKTRRFDAFWVDSIDTILVTIMSVAQIYLLACLLQSQTITAGDFVFIAMITLNINS